MHWGQLNLGFAYFYGSGLPRDRVEAVRWYRLAAAQGDAMAQRLLASAYELGEGVPRDYVQAYAWYSLAAAQSDADAREKLNLIETLLTSEQRAEAQKMAREKKPQMSK
jgi:TPR repeat protein